MEKSQPQEVPPPASSLPSPTFAKLAPPHEPSKTIRTQPLTNELVFPRSSINPTYGLQAEPLARSPDYGVSVEQTCQAKHRGLPAPVQMIGEDGAFNRRDVESIGMSDPCTIISIIGPRCSGKSYLLNHIFGTNFEVLHAAKGRRQTTKGIWLSKSTIPNFSVLDIGGSDGKDKQDQLLSERQIALFLIQLSNLIIVNMRLQDTNRQLGGSSTLLPAIFQEKIKNNSARTNILVAIRGYDDETPVDLLQSDVFENMKKLWESSVPHGSPMFEECIVPFVVALPDKSQEEDFKEGVLDLKDKLLKVCFPTTHKDFAYKAHCIWQSIQQNQQLNQPLPDLTVVTSIINCDRTIEEIVDNLCNFEGYHALKPSASLEEFWKAYTCLSNGTSTYFEKETENCDITVRNKKHQELKQIMQEIFDPAYRNIVNEHNREMQEKCKESIREQFMQVDDPMLIVNDCVKTCMEELVETSTYMSLMNKDVSRQLYESFQRGLSEYARNEAKFIQEKRKTVKVELSRDEMERKASSMCRETEALELEVISEKEKLSEAKQTAREIVERERQDALIRNQRDRENSQKQNDNLAKKIERAKEELRRKQQVGQKQGGFQKIVTPWAPILGLGLTLINCITGATHHAAEPADTQAEPDQDLSDI